MKCVKGDLLRNQNLEKRHQISARVTQGQLRSKKEKEKTHQMLAHAPVNGSVYYLVFFARMFFLMIDGTDLLEI